MGNILRQRGNLQIPALKHIGKHIPVRVNDHRILDLIQVILPVHDQILGIETPELIEVGIVSLPVNAQNQGLVIINTPRSFHGAIGKQTGILFVHFGQIKLCRSAAERVFILHEFSAVQIHVYRRKGIDILLDTAEFEAKAKNADLIITGEGRLDSQSVEGKVISGIAMRSASMNKKVIAICGSKGEGAEKIKKLGVSELYFACESEKTFDEILKTCKEDLYNAAFKAAKEISGVLGDPS